MKTIQHLLLSCLFAVTGFPIPLMAASHPDTCFASPAIQPNNESAYEKAMMATIEKLYQAGTIEELQGAVNQFETISRKETKEWLPLYYATLGYVWISTRTEQKAAKQDYLNRGQSLLDKAVALKADESELVALQGFLSMILMSTDPATLGPTLAGKTTATMERACQMNPENPRAMLLLSQMQMGTARYFGKSTEEACLLTKKSIAQFEAEKPANPLMPRWGEARARQVLEQCGK
jgi:hypothetical protein